MDPYYSINKLNELQEDIDNLTKVLLNRFETPLTERNLDEIHITMVKTSSTITALRYAMQDPEVLAKFAE